MMTIHIHCDIIIIITIVSHSILAPPRWCFGCRNDHIWIRDWRANLSAQFINSAQWEVQFSDSAYWSAPKLHLAPASKRIKGSWKLFQSCCEGGKYPWGPKTVQNWVCSHKTPMIKSSTLQQISACLQHSLYSFIINVWRGFVFNLTV